MSLTDIRIIELERQRKEQLRIEMVRQQARNTLETLRTTIQGITDPGMQQLCRADFTKIASQSAEISAMIETQPDTAIEKARQISSDLTNAITQGQAKLKAWSQQHTELAARISQIVTSLGVHEKSATSATTPLIEQMRTVIQTAQNALKQARYDEVKEHCKKAEAHIDTIIKAAESESVRHHVVSSLLSTLTARGFSIEQPEVKNSGSEKNVMVLSGRMPSGKQARFEVMLDGSIAFDLNGYQDRSCAKEVDQIDKSLNEHFGIKLGPSQVVWKNPDKIAKGARSTPRGGHNITY